VNRFVRFFITIMVCYNSASGSCNWSTGIKLLPDGNYEYNKECHLEVGSLVQLTTIQKQQIADYTKAISMKDLAIQQSDSRATLWSNTSASLEGRLQKVDQLEKDSSWLYFGLGILVMGVAVFGAAKLSGH
jgi:hypothetical protein